MPANNIVAKNNLGYLGIDFQYRLINAFFENPSFFKDMYPIVNQNMFTEVYLRMVVGIMKEYYAKYESTVTYDILSFKLREKAVSEDDIQLFDEVVDKLKNTTTEGIEEIEDLAEKFFKQQNWVRVANEIKRIAGDGDVSKYDECQRLMEEAMTIGKKKEEAFSPLDNVDEDLSKDNVVTIPTGVSKLDDCLGGGLDKGKIGLIIGPSSFGKSLCINELVASVKGFVQMGDIKIGDEVLGLDGLPHKVIGVFPQGKRRMFDVTFSNGTVVRCDGEHLWNVRRGFDKEFITLTLNEIIELNDSNIGLWEIPVCKKFNGDERHFITKIVDTGIKEEAQCIKVDTEDGLFLTRDYIVTHNTSMTTGFSAYAATCRSEVNNNNGFKVLQIVFEDTNRDINRKYFSRLTQIETAKLNESEETTQYVREVLENHPDRELIKNNIRIIHLDTGEYSATNIKDVIKRKINEGFKPDMVVLDYFECLNPEKGTGNMSKWEQETKTMRKLENYTKQLNIALWLPTQGNRGSLSSELVTMDQGSGSIGKQQIAQVVLSIARSVDDIKNQRATLAVLKNRSGAAGMVLNGIKFDNGTCTITCDNVIDFDNALEYNDYAEQQENKAKNNIIDDLRGPHRQYIT